MKSNYKTITSISIVFFLLILFLAACGPHYVIGLDAVAPNGHWMSVLEPVQDSSPQLKVIDLQTGEVQFTLTDPDIYTQPITIFSPSGEHLLYRGTEMWRLMDINNGNVVDFAPTTMDVEFLPNNEILIIYKPNEESQPQALSQLWLASPKLPELDNWMQITDQSRYAFRSRALSLSDASFLNPIPQSDLPAQALCPESTDATTDARIIVNAEGIVTVLTVDRNYFHNDRLSNLSGATIDLLHDYEVMISAMQQDLKNQATGTDETDKQAQVENAIARSGISGLASPDGKHLLLISAATYDTDKTKYSLNLINLETDTNYPLSVNSDWIPSSLFSPDGKQVIYESNMRGKRSWYLLTLDGSDPIKLNLQGITALCWQ